MYFMYKNSLFLSSCLIVSSCINHSARIDRRSQIEYAAREDTSERPAQNYQTNPPIAEYVSSLEFPIFDVLYDFNKTDKISAARLAAKFPVNRNEVAFLENGEDFFTARMQLLEQAKKSVKIQTLTFWSDEAAVIIANKLIDVANKGISVTIIIDAFHNVNVPERKLYAKLRSNGIKIEGYEFLYLNLINKLLQTNDYGLLIDEANMRYHEKLFIIDGEDSTAATAIIGGANIGNKYFRVTKEKPELMWRDRDVAVRGPVVATMNQAFENTLSEIRAEKSALLQLSELWWIGSKIFNQNQGKISLINKNRTLLERLDQNLQNASPMNFKPANLRFIQSRPRFREDLILPAYIDMINHAKKEILLINSYFLPDEDLLLAISAAVERGVKITILTNHAKSTDFRLLQLLTRSYYKDLLTFRKEDQPKDILEIYEWGGHAVLENGEGQNHSKYAVFDGKAVVVGSYNLDPRSRLFNSESVVVFEGKDAVAPFIKEFRDFIAPEFSQKISYEQAQEFEKNRSLLDSLQLQLGKIIEPLL